MKAKVDCLHNRREREKEKSACMWNVLQVCAWHVDSRGCRYRVGPITHSNSRQPPRALQPPAVSTDDHSLDLFVFFFFVIHSHFFFTIHDSLSLLLPLQIFYNGKGYGVVTPDTYRKTSVVENVEKGLLLSNEEALTLAHGTVESYPQGNVIHKAIQTNLVDVICRGKFVFLYIWKVYTTTVLL